MRESETGTLVVNVTCGKAGASGLDSLPQDFLTSQPIGAADRALGWELPGFLPPNCRDAVAEIERRVRGEQSVRLAGPVQFVLKLLQYWRLQTDDAACLLGFDKVDAEHVAAVLGGREQFRGRDVRDRIAHLFHIRATLFALFRDLETENNWLREPHPLLDERSPLSLMLGGSMEDLLLARDHVELAAGIHQI